MRYKYLNLSFVIIAILFQGCDLFPNILSRLARLNSETAKEGKFKIKISRDVLDCFSDKNVENLKKLLCFKT